MKGYGVPIAGVARVGWVRIEVGDDDTPTCHVVGTNRRRVVVRQVPLSTATALMARGVPSVVRHPRSDRRTSVPT